MSQGSSSDEIHALKKELADLRAYIPVLRDRLAFLKILRPQDTDWQDQVQHEIALTEESIIDTEFLLGLRSESEAMVDE